MVRSIVSRFDVSAPATLLGALAALTLATSAASAFPSGGVASTPADGSSFTSACVGQGFGGFGFGQTLGRDMSTFGLNNATFGPAICSSALSSGVGTVTSSAADGGAIGNLGGSYSGTSAGSATAGLVKLQAANTANQSQSFTGAATNGGWNDTYTIGNGSGTGLWVIPIHVSGSINAQGQGTTSIFQIMPYLNKQPIDTSPGYLGAFGHYAAMNQLQNGDVISAWTYEMSAWGATHNGTSDPLTGFSVNETVHLVVPITYGVSFDLGIYASALVGERAKGAAQGFADIQFQNTVAWLGAGYVLDLDSGSNIVGQNDNITVAAASGLDYTQSFLTAVPEPATLALFGLGLAALGVTARRRR